MCNAHNHPSGCRCGWGGEGHAGGGGNYYVPPNGWVERPVTPHTPVAPQTYASYVNPNAKCPVCSAAVFFYQSPYGGRVFFDELGPPWPKHPCTDRDSESFYIDFDVNLPPVTVEEPLNRATTIPQWQREGWEAYKCTGIDKDYHEGIARLKGKSLSVGTSLVLYRATPSYDPRKELMMVKCICKRAGRYLCETVEVSRGCVVSFRFTAYSKIDSSVFGWPVDYLSAGERYSYEGVRAELKELAKWFAYTIKLPFHPFILSTGERVHNPINYYEGLHILLSKPPVSKVGLSGIRLATKLQRLREYVQATCNGED